ncbi:MAG: ATP-binding cassette domain-containing protein [Lachnospiraceae bacterium]|nr:ATP-binding cassette domain-containing protein [Lachnospiraceae bacterium]
MDNLIEVQNLKKYFKTGGGMLHAVDDVSFGIPEGATMGVVGESGCGKSTLGRTMIHLLESTDGKILFQGEDVTSISKSQLRRFREKATIIFQDPYSSLDPRFTVEKIIREPLVISKKFSKGEIDDKVDELMEMVGIDPRLSMSYPHELDGGRRQRIGIARALALDPKFIVCDEPVSALDVSIQAQVLNLLQDLQESKHLTYMFVTHNMSVVRHISDHICVMYLGQLVETAKTETVFEKPYHPYTKALLSAIPSSDIHKKIERIPMKGEINSPIDPKPGCRFATRCPYAVEECQQPQSLTEVEPGHFVSCCQVKRLNG